MISHRLLSGIAATIVVTGITFASPAIQAQAEQQALVSGKTIAGRISEGESRIFKFDGKTRLGEEYTFEAEPGYRILATAVPETKSKLSMALIGPDGTQTPFKNQNQIHWTVAIGGRWRLRVLGPDDDKTVRYNLGVIIKDANGLTVKPEKPEPTLAFADQVMKKINLPTVPCGGSDLAEIKIRADIRCTRSYSPGEYVYNEATNRLEKSPSKNPIPSEEPHITELKNWGLTPVPCGSSGLASISVDGKTACVLPTASIPAGQYVFKRDTFQLVGVDVPPGSNVPGPGAAPPPETSGPEI